MDGPQDAIPAPDAEGLRTIPEAAAHLGIHEKRLRRLLARPKYRDRTQTRTRTQTRRMVLSAFYERLLTEKDVRIAELTAALGHEREQARRLAEALAREQALPAPTSPEAAPDAPEASKNAQGGPETGATVGDGGGL
ncbi:MAG: hypothetical protein JO250_21020 [Armatimonadetes bacterium]|nr:hypothetical protein [Armatimonadota bacterium]